MRRHTVIKSRQGRSPQQILPLNLVGQYRALQRPITAAIQRVLNRGQFILGPEVEAFEQEVAAYCETKYAIGVASGTDALELALRAMGIDPGDEVITTAFSFFAPGSAIASLGAVPVFVDIDPVSYAIDPQVVEAAVTSRPKAIISVHLYGLPCDLGAIRAIARRAKLKVLEDCAQAIGATYQGRRVGSVGDAGALSFYPTKNLGAYGDGGMVVTNDARIAEQVRLVRLQGSRDRVHHEVVSRNSRLDELQAAILRVKLPHLDAWNTARRAHAQRYHEALTKAQVSDLMLPQTFPRRTHVYHLYVIRSRHRAAIRDALSRAGIVAQVHYEVPLHLERAFAALGYRPGSRPHAERAAQEVLALPMYPELTAQMIQRIVDVIADVSP